MSGDPCLAAIRRPLRLPAHFLYRFYEGGLLTRKFRGLPGSDDWWSEDWVGSVTTAGNRDPEGNEQGLSSVNVPGVGLVTIAELVRRYPEQMVGAAFAHRWGPTTGVLVKLISPGGRVPLHGHPDRAFARRHLNSSFGKAEAWIMLETPGVEGESPYAGIGFKPGVTEAMFRRAIARQASDELRSMLHRTEIHPGEAWVMHPRVPHFLGPRLLFIEVQEPTDHIVIPEWWASGVTEQAATMGLGWDIALRMLDFEATGDRETALGRARQQPTVLSQKSGSASKITRLFNSDVLPFFDAHRLYVADEIPIEDQRFAIDIVIRGDGWIAGDFGRQPIAKGQTFATAASVPHRFVTGTEELEVVRCMGPHLD